jgi:ubiquinone/menaquinone biosynthesis C-methylase UbiE
VKEIMNPNSWDKITERDDLKNPLKRLWSRNEVWVELFDEHLLGCKRILDVDCGAGAICIPLALKGYEAYAFDLSDKMIRLTRKRAEELKTSVIFLICDSHNLPAKDNSFDATICKFVLWPLKDVERGIEEMIRVTKPTGKIVVVEVDRTDNSMHKSGVHWKIKYHVCKMLNFLTRERSRKHRSAWNAIKEAVKSNPKINSEHLSDLMEKNGCMVYHVDKSIKEKTTGILGRICDLMPPYFLMAGEKII